MHWVRNTLNLGDSFRKTQNFAFTGVKLEEPKHMHFNKLTKKCQFNDLENISIARMWLSLP